MPFWFLSLFLVASLFCLSARVSHYCLPVLLAFKDFQLSKMASTVPDIPPNPVEVTYLLLISSVSASKTHFVTLIFYGPQCHTHYDMCVRVCVHYKANTRIGKSFGPLICHTVEEEARSANGSLHSISGRLQWLLSI